MKRQTILAKLKKLKPILFSKYKTKEIGLFGSFVRGEQTKDSDIDILVEFEPDADLFDLIGLSQFLEEELQRKVDVVPKRVLREELRDLVLLEVVAV